jgi:16S rRNA G1207 methylase RsmC
VWPASTKELFTCATVRYPSTRNAAAMVMTATASRLAPNASIYLYGARVEGIHSACFVTGGAGDRKGNEQGDTFHPAVPRDLFTDPEIVSTSRCGGFAVARCLRKETLAEETSDGKAQDVSRKKNPGSSMEAFRKTATLVLPASDSSPNGGETTTVTDWHTYPGLFAGGGLDVMTNVLLKAMPGKFGLERNHENAPFTVLDYCAGSGVLAAALQSRIPQNSVLTLCDADSVALHCARENFVVNAHHTQRTVVVPSDCFGGLSPTETFDLIVSNPPVHLGLQSEFTVLRQLLCECVNRLNNGGTCWLVAQRYVPVAAMAHEENVDVACAFADDKFAAWVLRKGSSDSEEKSDTKEGTTSKKDKKDKKEQKEKKEKKK